MSTEPPNQQRPHGGPFLRVIAVFKFLEALTAIATGLATLELLKVQVVARMLDWAEDLPLATEQRLAQHLLGWLTGLGAHRIKELGVFAFVFAAIFLAEGVGLWQRRTWAEWLTVLATALLIPMELWELFQHATIPKFLALVVNLVVVAYLARQIRVNAAGNRAVIGPAVSSQL